MNWWDDDYADYWVDDDEALAYEKQVAAQTTTIEARLLADEERWP